MINLKVEYNNYFAKLHGYANSGILFIISGSLKFSGKHAIIFPAIFSPFVGDISHQNSKSF